MPHRKQRCYHLSRNRGIVDLLNVVIIMDIFTQAQQSVITYYIIPMNINELAICNCEVLSCSKVTCNWDVSLIAVIGFAG
jgi:hypothetical protein